MPSRYIALDTEILLGIQACSPQAVEAHQFLRRKGALFLAPPTVVWELEKIRAKTHIEFSSALAANILDDPRRLDLVLASSADLQYDLAEIHTSRLLDRRILEENFKGDLSALIEAAYLDCGMFITDVPEVLRNRQQLTLALIQDCGMTSLYIFSPAEIVTFFRDGQRF